MSTKSTIADGDTWHLFHELVPDFDGAEVQMEIPRRYLIEHLDHDLDGNPTVTVSIPQHIIRVIQSGIMG